jgi:signal transduction histidine kinase
MSRTGDGRVRIAVHDDGVGFDPESLREWNGTRNGIGLFSLREDLELIGGRLDVESAPGSGTTCTVLGPPHADPPTDALRLAAATVSGATTESPTPTARPRRPSRAKRP